jgi:hypothetical protein
MQSLRYLTRLQLDCLSERELENKSPAIVIPNIQALTNLKNANVQ